ncbi:MAG: redox-regulated ATPase YchF [Promethearchaeota archaeon]
MLIGIVGKPSSGKSTFLNSACLTEAKVGNYPFTTIEPNLGKGFVRIDCICKDLKVKDNPKNSICINGIRFIPVKLLDVAGLVPDAHKGKGMGNKFLSDLSRADVLIHVIDISGSLDAEGQEIDEGSRDPLEDITFLEREINYWFRDILIRKDWQKFIRKIEQEKLHFADVFFERMAGISVKKDHIILAMKESKLDFEHLTSWNEEDVLLFATKLREISKPIVVVANKIDKPVSEKIFKEISKKIKNFLPCSALAELWLRKYAEKEIIEYLPGNSSFIIKDESKLKPQELDALNNIQEKILNIYGSTGIQNVINFAVFNVLNQIVVYPVYDLNLFSDKDGNVLPDAHLVEKGTKLKEFVNEKIHSDLAKNFIYGINGKTKLRLGESYVLENNDVIKIVSAIKGK